MGYSTGGKNSVSSYSENYNSKNSVSYPSGSGKNSVSSKNSVPVVNSIRESSLYSSRTNDKPKAKPATNKKLDAAKEIKVVLDLLAEETDLQIQKDAIEKQIECVQKKIETKVNSLSDDPVFQSLKSKILKL